HGQTCAGLRLYLHSAQPKLRPLPLALHSARTHVHGKILLRHRTPALILSAAYAAEMFFASFLKSEMIVFLFPADIWGFLKNRPQNPDHFRPIGSEPTTYGTSILRQRVLLSFLLFPHTPYK